MRFKHLVISNSVRNVTVGSQNYIFQLKKLPIGINSLANIHESDMDYVDKTSYALDLARDLGARHTP